MYKINNLVTTVDSSETILLYLLASIALMTRQSLALTTIARYIYIIWQKSFFMQQTAWLPFVVSIAMIYDSIIFLFFIYYEHATRIYGLKYISICRTRDILVSAYFSCYPRFLSTSSALASETSRVPDLLIYNFFSMIFVNSKDMDKYID